MPKYITTKWINQVNLLKHSIRIRAEDEESLNRLGTLGSLNKPCDCENNLVYFYNIKNTVKFAQIEPVAFNLFIKEIDSGFSCCIDKPLLLHVLIRRSFLSKF